MATIAYILLVVGAAITATIATALGVVLFVLALGVAFRHELGNHVVSLASPAA